MILDANIYLFLSFIRSSSTFKFTDDPIFCGGHWIVDMLEIAGGDYVMPVKHGGRSVALTNEDFVKLDPDVILIGPCGFSLDRTVRDTLNILGQKDWWNK